MLIVSVNLDYDYQKGKYFKKCMSKTQWMSDLAFTIAVKEKKPVFCDETLFGDQLFNVAVSSSEKTLTQYRCMQ